MSKVAFLGVEGSLRSREDVDIGSSCDDNSPFKSFTIPLLLYSEPESHSLDKEDFTLSLAVAAMAFLISASLTLILRRLRATEVGVFPFIVRSGDYARIDAPMRSATLLGLASSASPSGCVSSESSFGNTFCIGGRGFPRFGVFGWLLLLLLLLNISFTGEDFGEFCCRSSRGMGGTGGGGVSSD